MKIVYRTSDYPDVLIKKGLLEEAGYLVHVDNLNAAASMPELGFTVGYSIFVPDEQVSSANAFLRDLEGEAKIEVSTEADPETNNIDTCPKCGHWNVVRHRSILWLPLLWILGLVMPSYGGRHRKCLECGYAYRIEGSDLNPLLKVLLVVVVVFVSYKLYSQYPWFHTSQVPLFYS